MMKLMTVTVVALLALTEGLLAQPAQRPAPRLPENTKVLRDVEYAKSPQKPLLLDLYVPRSDKPLPLIVWIHGGAWRGGNKANPPALPLLSHGYALASISYRLSQEAIFPAQIHDCKAAIRFLRANAKAHNIDPVADWFGPTDFLKMGKNAQDHDAPDSPESRLIGGPIQENKEKVAKANPIIYVSGDDPPFLIMHGDQDNLVPINQSELLRDALQKAGVPVTYKVMEGMGHGFRGSEPGQMVREFFDRHLKK